MATRSIIIDQRCAFIKEQKMLISTNQLKESFDAITAELNKFTLANSINMIKQILVSLNMNDVKSYGEPDIIDHQLFLIARDCYLDISCQWRDSHVLDKSSYEVFLKISVLFDLMCVHVTDVNVHHFQKLLIYKPLIDEMSAYLMEIATNGKYLQDPQINAVDFMMKAIYRIFQGRTQVQNNLLLTPYLNAIVSCVCSPFFIDIFKQITEIKELDEAQALLLDTCTDYFSWYGGNRREEFCTVIRTGLLSPFTNLLINHASSWRSWSKVTIDAIKKVGNIVLDFDMQHEEDNSEEIYDNCYKTIDCFVSILSSVTSLETENTDGDFLAVLLLQLYLLTPDQTLLSYIKNQQLAPILLKLVHMANEWTQFNAYRIQFHTYRILAWILTEQDIKVLANPSTIVNVFLTFLRNVIDDSSKILRLRSLLRSLKSLVQHDQIKEELTRQGMLPLLLRCATESKFDPSKEQQPALEILLTLTFNDRAALILKQNSAFLAHLQTLLTSSPEKEVQRAAEGLIWKLEKQETTPVKLVFPGTAADASIHTYDIMLSYSHNDKELCYRLHNRLVKDNFRVWIDRDHMHGATMVAMAHAIENSQFVIICMSDTYKQSAYCRSEAHYAFERQCHFIPVVMKEKYRPDGWLGILVSGKVFIDFPKLDFDQAYLKLKNEIKQYRRNLGHFIGTKQSFYHSSPQLTVLATMTDTRGKDQSEHRATIKEYPHCIDLWTNEHVTSFLINENLNSLLPVFDNMNGRLVHDIYTMCRLSRESMFQQMKDEVAADGQQKPLTLGTYLTFLDKVKKYIPYVRGDSSQAAVVCTVM